MAIIVRVQVDNMLEKALRGAVVPEDIAGAYRDKEMVASTGSVVCCSLLTHSL